MVRQYLNILKESLRKKDQILKEIISLNEKQAEILKEETFNEQAFEESIEEKGKLIDALNSLDDGFDTVFSHIEPELSTEKGRETYAVEIQEMQELIRSVSAKSMTIQAGEQRNKKAVERYFRKARIQIKSGRDQSKIARNYYQNMRQAGYLPPQFLDSKK